MGTQALKYLGTWVLEALYLADSVEYCLVGLKYANNWEALLTGKPGEQGIKRTYDPDYDSTSSACDDESENKSSEKEPKLIKNINYIRQYKNYGLRKPYKNGERNCLKYQVFLRILNVWVRLRVEYYRDWW